jgi:hypothetical protein
VHLRRQVLQEKGQGLVHRWGVDNVVIVEDEDEITRQLVVISLSSAVRIASMGGRGSSSPYNAPAPTFGASVRKAATRWARKRAGSLSAASSDSQVTGRAQAATQALTSVVLPKPAGGPR